MSLLPPKPSSARGVLALLLVAVVSLVLAAPAVAQTEPYSGGDPFEPYSGGRHRGGLTTIGGAGTEDGGGTPGDPYSGGGSGGTGGQETPAGTALGEEGDDGLAGRVANLALILMTALVAIGTAIALLRRSRYRDDY